MTRAPATAVRWRSWSAATAGRPNRCRVLRLRREMGVEIGMDGKKCRMDNIFIGRLWLRVKYERLHLQGHATPNGLRHEPVSWFKR